MLSTRSGGKVCGYKATAWENGKEIYLGFSKTIEGAVAIRKRYDEAKGAIK